MRIDPARRADADHLRHESVIAADHVLGDAPGLDDLLPVIDVVQESVDRAHPLFDPARQLEPFRSRYDARDDVEGDQAFLGLGPPIDIEGDAREAKKLFGLALLGAQARRILIPKPVVNLR